MEAGGETGGELALEMFTKAGETGGANTAEIRHGKAIAYSLMGDEEGLKKETEALRTENEAYFEKFSTEVEIKLDKVENEESSN